MMKNNIFDVNLNICDIVGELETIANQQGARIYNICHRNAGWAIEWFEENKQGCMKNWKAGLVVYEYYPTLFEAIKGESARLEKAQQKAQADAGWRCPNCQVINNSDFDVCPVVWCKTPRP